MILINFSHPLTPEMLDKIAELIGPTERQVDAPVHFDEQHPFAPQLRALIDGLDIASTEWQTAPILIVLPSLNFIAAAMLAELHGRMGYFPSIVRTRPIAGQTPRAYEVAEILNLQNIRDAARQAR